MNYHRSNCRRREFVKTGVAAACVMAGGFMAEAEEKESVILKPHHFIALFRDLGDGSDPGRYTNGNDYERAYRMVMNAHSLPVISTVGVDFICGPCMYLKDGKCTATISGHGPDQPLQDWARTVDTRIMKALLLSEGSLLTARKLAEWCRERLGTLDAVFMEEDEENRIRRALSMHVGLNKYLSEKSLQAGMLVL